MTVAASKSALRKRIAASIAALPAATIAAESAQVAARVFALDVYRGSRTLSCYLSMPAGELQTKSIIEDALKSKNLLVPRVTGKKRTDMAMLLVSPGETPDDFPRSPWNIPEPPLTVSNGSPRQQWMDMNPPLDLVIVPGVAFTRDGKRLGHGRGYFDTYLQSLMKEYEERGLKKPLTVGICLSCQVVEDVPMDEWDQYVDLVVSP